MYHSLAKFIEFLIGGGGGDICPGHHRPITSSDSHMDCSG
jgi:hypothetical protein